MPFNGSGTFNPLITFQANTPATASDQNSQDTDIATGLSTCVTRSGQSPATANLPMGGFKFTGMGNGSASTDSIAYGQVYGSTGVIPPGTQMLFLQAAAPTGWTQNTSYNDYALRIVSGTGAGVHGSVGLSAFISGGTQETTLSIAQIPSGLYSLNDPGHNHTTGLTGGDAFAFEGGPDVYCPQGNPLTSGTGFSKTGITMTDNSGGGAHNHGLQDLQYLDCLLATKN